MLRPEEDRARAEEGGVEAERRARRRTAADGGARASGSGRRSSGSWQRAEELGLVAAEQAGRAVEARPGEEARLGEEARPEERVAEGGDAWRPVVAGAWRPAPDLGSLTASDRFLARWSLVENERSWGKKKRRPDLKGKDLSSRLVPPTGTKGSFVPVGATNRDERPTLSSRLVE